MSSMIDYWGDLGATVGQGITGYANTTRLLEDRERLRRQQEEDRARAEQDRARQQALQNLQFHQGEAETARRSGNLPGAAAMYQKMLADRNAFDGGNRVGVKFIGEPETLQVSGPLMPNQERPTVANPNAGEIDWKNPANTNLLDGGIGYVPKQPTIKTVPFGSGGLMLVTQNPDGTVATEVIKEPVVKPLVLPQGTVAVDPVTREQVAQGAPKTFAPRSSRGGGGAAPKPRYGWVQQADGTKVWAELKPGTVSAPAPKKDKKADADPYSEPEKPAAAHPAKPMEPNNQHGFTTPRGPNTASIMYGTPQVNVPVKPAPKPKAADVKKKWGLE